MVASGVGVGAGVQVAGVEAMDGRLVMEQTFMGGGVASAQLTTTVGGGTVMVGVPTQLGVPCLMEREERHPEGGVPPEVGVWAEAGTNVPSPTKLSC